MELQQLCASCVHNPSVSKNHLNQETATAGEMTRLVTFINAGRHIEAEEKARELLTRDPNSGFAWKVLGLCLWAQGKNGQYALENATKLSPDDAEAHSNLGNALLETGQLDQAVQSCRRALEIKPHLAEAHSNMGNALCGLGRLDEAIVSYLRALEIQPSFAMVHNNLGSALRGFGRLDEAIVSYRRALEIQPSFATAHNNLGNALRGLGRLDEAVASYLRALDLKHDYVEAHNNLGNALLDLGKTHEAAASYRRALEIRHDYAEAHSNLGNALQILGQLDEAVASCRKAIQSRSDFAEAHNNLGNALRGLKQFDQALGSYRRALEIKPDYAEAHANAGDALLELSQLHEAAASYRRALEIKPDYAEAHGKLGNVLRHLWQTDDSAASCRRALAIKPDYAEAHDSLGCALLDLGHLENAEASFRQALKLKPDYAEAHNNLGFTLRLENRAVEAEVNCRKALEINPGLTSAVSLLAELHGDKGQFGEAEHLYQRAISIDPDLPMPWAGIPHLRKMTRGDSAWLSEAQRIADKHPPPRQEAALRYALGKYFDDVKDFEQAFSNYQRANELAKSYRRKYDRPHQQRRIDQIIRLYDREWMSRTRRSSNPSSRPVFIVGLPRTGTTLAEQILASHPAVFGAGAKVYWCIASAEHESCMASGDDSEILIGELARDYLRLLKESSTDALRVVDKMTTNFMCLGLIHAALPNARIIHMRRNPIDTCLSNYFIDFSIAHSHANDLEDLAHYYTEYSRLMEHWRLTLPENSMLEVPYETLVDGQEAWSRKMLEFIGLPWDARCIDFHKTYRSVITASRWQVRQKMGKASVERWRNYARFIEPLLRSMQAPEDAQQARGDPGTAGPSRLLAR
jgi:tetratricopeptide (TPR) repeat protein